MSALLAPSYWAMSRLGVDFARRPHLAIYLLTVLGVTLPVAASAGLIYRMGRLFELRRPWRATLGLVAVLASGMVSYATVLNPHAPAAALVLCAAACLIHVSLTNKRFHGSVWLTLSGLCAALAAAIDPPAVVFLLLLPAVLFTLRWTRAQRLGGVAAYVLGATVPLLLHASLSAGVEGYGFRVRGPAGNDSLFSFLNPDAGTVPLGYDELVDFEEEEPRTAGEHARAGAARLASALAGRHGLLSHFPVVLLGVIGVSIVMHRHWPAPTKMLASVSLAGALLLLVLFTLRRADWHGSMFASRWFVVFVPLLVFWAGAWLRRRHTLLGWTAAGGLLAFSLAASVIGATGPLPRDGFVAPDGSAALHGRRRPAETSCTGSTRSRTAWRRWGDKRGHFPRAVGHGRGRCRFPGVAGSAGISGTQGALGPRVAVFVPRFAGAVVGFAGAVAGLPGAAAAAAGAWAASRPSAGPRS
jgi:hypothetical protein